MPNFVMIGYDQKSEATIRIKKYIGIAVRRLDIFDAVITSINSDVKSIGSTDSDLYNGSPYIILRTTSKREVRKIIKELKKIHFFQDIEVEIINHFIPRTNMC